MVAFFSAEQLERIVGKQDLSLAPRWRYQAAGVLVVLAVIGLAIGQPTTAERWEAIADEKQAELDNRNVQIHPAELLSLIYDPKVKVVMLDVRSERDFNLFHIEDSEWIGLPNIPDAIEDLRTELANTVFVTISNDEADAAAAWRTLVAESVPNVYILGGGINGWISVFATEDFLAEYPPIDVKDDELSYAFTAALGARYFVARPHIDSYEHLEFEKKVELDTKRGPASGGCG